MTPKLKKAISNDDGSVATPASTAAISIDHIPSDTNTRVIECLRRMLRTGIESRTFLLSGPQGIGKTSLALSIARALICSRTKNGAVCGTCQDCTSLAGRRHPDIAIIDTADDRIGIDVIRELTRSFSQRPVLSSRHIAIIDRSERMTEEAANAFLKSLEEPSGNTVYILTTNAIDLLPKTVVSRCIVFHLTTTPINNVIDSLIKQGIDKQEARKLAVFTCGRTADALFLATHPAAFDQAKKDAATLVELIDAPIHDRIAHSESISESNEGIHQMLGTIERWESILYRMLKISAGLPDRGPEAERLTNVVRSTDSPQPLIRTLDALIDLKLSIHSSGNIRLNLESFALHLPYLKT